MCSCSNSISNVSLVICFIKVMVPLIGPYSCLLFSMCNAYDDWGGIVFYVSNTFLISLM